MVKSKIPVTVPLVPTKGALRKRRAYQKAKISDHNMEKSQPEKNVWDEYTDMNKLKKVPVNNSFIDNMILDLIKTIQEDVTIIRMSQLYKKWGMREIEFKRLRDKYPKLQDTYIYLMERLAERREVETALKDGLFNWNVIASTQAHYCNIEKSEQIRRAELRKNEEQKPTNVTVMFGEEIISKKEQE